MEVLVFGGTVEGRLLVEWLAKRGTCTVVACTATDYGASLVDANERVKSLVGPLSAAEKSDLMQAHDFVCVVDATHPFAQHISSSVDELAHAWDVDVVRVLREGGATDVGTVFSSAADAAAYLAQTTGNILLTTGTRDLAAFVSAMPDFADRLFVRILPVRASLATAKELGIPTSHIVAMQGPASAQLNEALIDEFGIEHLVTKESGPAGGFDDKVLATQRRGIELVVVERPRQREGVSLAEAKRLLEERYGL